MIKKVLIANRGEIAVRIIRTCRDMGIATVSLYEDSDYGSLHVLLADECVRLENAKDYGNQELIIKLALLRNVDAIHPGYGFLAENADFARACLAANLIFIGPSAGTLNNCASKIDLLNLAKECGLPLLEYSEQAFAAEDFENIAGYADKLGYPLLVKSTKGSNVSSARLASRRDEMQACVAWSSRKGQLLFAESQVYLEKSAEQPSRTLLVPFLAFAQAEPIMFPVIDVSLNKHNTRIFCECPAPGLTKLEQLTEAASRLVEKLDYQGLGSVEFLLDKNGKFYFQGLQARIQIEHPVIELLTGLDLVQEQIKIASGIAPCIPKRKAEGVTMQCRVYAEDLLRQNLPSPGILSRFRLPGGPQVRVDAFAYAGCQIPSHFNPLLATIACWGETREACLDRMRRALRDTAATGVKTNLARIQTLMHDSAFVDGLYNCDTAVQLQKLSFSNQSDAAIAAIAAIAFKLRTQRRGADKPERFSGAWHAANRTLSDT